MITIKIQKMFDTDIQRRHAFQATYKCTNIVFLVPESRTVQL